MSLSELFVFFLLCAATTCLSGCHAVGTLPPRPVEPASRASAHAGTEPGARHRRLAIQKRSRVHAVLTVGPRAYVLSERGVALPASRSRSLLPGGYAFEFAHLAAHAEEPITLVGPAGTCVGRASEDVAIRLDLGGYSGASLPTPARAALAVDGCSELVARGGFLLAFEGRDPEARWVHPAHLDDAPLPADHQLGEDEVWVHRFALGESDFSIAERSVIRYATPSCSEEQRTTIVLDEDDRPLASYDDFALFGVIQAGGHEHVVLAGHDDPEALRVVELGPAEARVALDTHLASFPDAGRGC
jgi:hypothetical protein